jgi:hypothetical protein
MSSGDDLRIVIDVYDTDGHPVDISTATSIKWAMAKNQNSTKLIERELGVNLSIASPISFFFDIESADTELLSGNFYHEAEIVTDTGLTYTGVSGQFKIKKTLIKA